MSSEFIALFLAGAACGGFINGLAGFGTALLSLSFWLQIMPAWQAVTIVAAMSVISGVQSLWLIRRDLAGGIHRFPRFLVPALIGIPLGAATLSFVNATALKFFIAGFMLLYGGFFTLLRSLPRIEREKPVWDAVIGFLGGVLGGSASLSGVLPTMWCAMQPWSKGHTSAVLRPYNVTVLGIAIGIFAYRGYFNQQTLMLVAMAFPVTIVFSQIGVAVFKRLTDDQFRRLLVWMLFASGISLALNEFFRA